jgi:hypothetical protein
MPQGTTARTAGANVSDPPTPTSSNPVPSGHLVSEVDSAVPLPGQLFLAVAEKLPDRFAGASA